MSSDRERDGGGIHAPSFLAIIDAEDKVDPQRQAKFANILAQHRASRANRDPAVTAALRARFNADTQADAA